MHKRSVTYQNGAALVTVERVQQNRENISSDINYTKLAWDAKYVLTKQLNRLP